MDKIESFIETVKNLVKDNKELKDQVRDLNSRLNSLIARYNTEHITFGPIKEKSCFSLNEDVAFDYEEFTSFLSNRPTVKED